MILYHFNQRKTDNSRIRLRAMVGSGRIEGVKINQGENLDLWGSW